MSDKTQDRPEINRNVHPPIVALIFIAIAYLLGWLFRLPIGVPAILGNIGFGMTIFGFLLGISAFLEFRKMHTSLDPHGSVKQLVTTGIYQFTRNPIYLGFFLMVIGLPLTSGLYWGILLAPIFIFTMTRLVIEREEVYLEKKFKEQYTDYKSRVKRWL